MLKLSFAFLALLMITTPSRGQFYEAPADIPEEDIYPDEAYEEEMEIQRQQEEEYPWVEEMPGEYESQEELDPESLEYQDL